MISNHLSGAYPSPLSAEMVKDYRGIVDSRLKATLASTQSIEAKVERNLSPEVTKLFNVDAKSTLDLYA